MRALLLLLLVGCYRESSSPPTLGNQSDPALLAQDAACSKGDDLDATLHDVFDVGRLRTNVHGPLTANNQRTWAGPAIPSYVPQTHGTLELTILDKSAEGHLAFYRDPYGASSCTLAGKTNCAYLVELYRPDGARAWSLPLNPLLSRPDGLEIQDVRIANGTLLFNEACQSYSAEQGGACSALVAVDPASATVKWRTPNLVSNGRFAVRGCYVIAGYGFTSEPDNVFLVERASGKITQTIAVSSAPQAWKHIGRERVDLRLSSGAVRRYRLADFATRSGRLVDMDSREYIEAYGGNSYGGATYGGATYGGASYGGPRKH